MVEREGGRERLRATSRKSLVGQLLRFFVGTIVGLGIDIGLYSLLTLWGVLPFAANLVSSAAAVCFLYYFSSRHVFRVDYSVARFIAFVTWYTLSIVAFSFLVQIVYDLTGWSAVVSKVVTLPLSFVANYVGSRLALHIARKRTA